MTCRGFCEVDALSRYTRGCPLTRCLRIGKSSRIVAGIPIPNSPCAPAAPAPPAALAAVGHPHGALGVRGHQDLAPLHAHRVDRHRPDGRQREHPAGLHVEPGPVLGTDHHLAGERALAEGGFLVAAGIVDREDLPSVFTRTTGWPGSTPSLIGPAR